MGDMREYGEAMNAYHKERKARNLAQADPSGWTQRTPYHWQRDLNGKVVDYWPSRNKWRYEGRTRVGDIVGWLRKREHQIT